MADDTISKGPGSKDDPVEAFRQLFAEQSQAAHEFLRQQAQAGGALWGQLLPSGSSPRR